MCKGEAEESAVKVAKRKGWTETHASELRVSPYGRRGRVRHNCRAHSDLRRRWPSSDLDAGEAALWNGRSDGHRVPVESDQGKEAGSCTLDCLLHVLAEMARLRCFGLPLGKSLAPGPVFAAACPMRMGEASWEAIITSRLAAAVRGD